MKKSISKCIITGLTVASMLACTVPAMAAEAPADGGTIMWLSNLQSGVQYDSTVDYMTAICNELGYNFTVVYGDGFNDAAGNLQAVKNAMTPDVVGIMVSQDGGLATIMEEFPDVYIAGYNTDMLSVFGGGENAAVLENDHFLGTICDGYADGANTAKSYFDTVVEKGFKKIAVINFPGFAYPNLEVATNAFIGIVEEYNASAADEDKIEIVGAPTTLMFSPVEDSWFLDGENGSVDAIVGFCAGTLFIYPQLVTAIINGTCRPDMKLLTSGYESDEAITDAIGDSEGKVIASVSVSPSEDPAFAMVLLDNAITGNQYDDFEVTRTDAFEYIIKTDEEIANVTAKSMLGTGLAEYAQIPVDMVVNELCRRNNPDATFAMLQEVFHDSSLLGAAALK